MATYRYRAKKGPNGVMEGAIEASSEKEAIEKLSGLGYIPVFIEEGKPSHEGRAQHSGKSAGKVRSREITMMSRELASLLRSGVPLLKALSILIEQSESANFKTILNDIHDSVKEGTTFSSALSLYPKTFPPLYIAMIRTGEGSGALPDALLRISEHRAKQEDVLSRFRMALAYPVLMAVVGLCTIIFMFTFVVPRLMKIYLNTGQALPIPTQVLISISQGIRDWWFWIILILGFIILIANRHAQTKAGKYSISVLKLRLPLFGNFILKAELARFSRTLALLIKNGLPILNAIDIAIPVLENEVTKDRLKESYKELEEGGSFGRCLKGSKSIPIFMSNLVIVGEESGRLDEALDEIANTYERDTDETIKIFSSMLEPIMILVMGLIVGFVVVAMLLPIFEINMM
ncbi:MAG: type II secretion system F family protein [Candidatus Omnitrophota bacterium]